MAATPVELMLPAPALARLRRVLSAEAGEDVTTRALHAAGFEAGASLFGVFAPEGQAQMAALPGERFWHRLRDFFASRGWGSLDADVGHRSVGILSSKDWAEVGEGGSTIPACAVSTGMLSRLLTEVAGSPVAVVEVACRACGSDECTFVFGAEATIYQLHESLLGGTPLATALEHL